MKVIMPDIEQHDIKEDILESYESGCPIVVYNDKEIKSIYLLAEQIDAVKDITKFPMPISITSKPKYNSHFLATNKGIMCLECGSFDVEGHSDENEYEINCVDCGNHLEVKRRINIED